MSRTAIIEIHDVVKVYDTGEIQVRALNGVSLKIYDGDFVALMGASGSGKSTLMNLLGCLDRPTSGTYLFCGQDVSRLSRNQLAEIRSKKIGFVFQGFNLLHRTSAIDNVQLPLIYSTDVSTKEARQRALSLLEKVGLANRQDHHPNQLSGGQQQRVAIARALVNHPAVLLADEPTGNLDTHTGLEILAEFQRLNDEEGQTIVMVTHDRDIANCCRRQVVMQDGRVIADMSTQRWRNARDELSAMDSRAETAAIGAAP
jgi:putative ABC transport system ATP-binding protein